VIVVATAHALVVVLMLTVSHGVLFSTTPQFAASLTRRPRPSLAGADAGHEKCIGLANERHEALFHVR
jgi:hypothetical protein